jgi:hypothetical protein
MNEQGIIIEEDLPPLTPNVLEINDRITARIDVYHEQRDEPPKDFHIIFSGLSNQSEEDVYSRKMEVTEEWTPVDKGWVSDVGFVLLTNTKKKYRVNPDGDEIESEKKKIIRIRTDKIGDGWRVEKGMFFFGHPSNIATTEIKCEFETTTVELSIFPK